MRSSRNNERHDEANLALETIADVRLMTTPKDEYLRRYKTAGLLRLTSLHHHVMDRVFAEFADGFSFDDILELTEKDPEIVDTTWIEGNLNRVRLLVMRALDGLVAVEMLKESKTEKGVYDICWPPAP
jgi:hypothetical protein